MLPDWPNLALTLSASATAFGLFLWWFGAQST
jgi:hypothetical protein